MVMPLPRRHAEGFVMSVGRESRDADGFGIRVGISEPDADGFGMRGGRREQDAVSVRMPSAARAAVPTPSRHIASFSSSVPQSRRIADTRCDVYGCKFHPSDTAKRKATRRRST